MKHILHFFSQQGMKAISFVFAYFLIISFQPIHAQDVVLAGVDYRIDTVRQFVAGPGSEYLQVRMTRWSDGEKPLDVYFLRVDTRNPYIRMEQVLGKDQLVGTERPTAMMARKSTPTSVYIGGANGDFFDQGVENGRPIGLTIGNNEFAYIGHPHYKIGVVKEDGKPEIGNSNWLAADQQVTWVYTGKLVVGSDTLPIHHVNYHRNENELVLYNHYQGATTGTNDYGSEAVLSLLPGEKWTTSGKMKAKVESVVANKGNSAIGANTFVLSGHGTMKAIIEGLNAGDEVEIIYSLIINNKETKVAQCVSGHQTNLMVDNGVVVTENFWNELHPRTGYGYSQTGDTIIFCVVDGRTTKSIGCTTQVLGAIMRHYGAWWALNWDGGGSSCLAINHLGQMNNGSDNTGERAVANGMFAIAEVPEDDQVVDTLCAHKDAIKLPRHGVYMPTFFSYNKYGVMLSAAATGVVLSCDASLGEIQADGSFMASGTAESGILYARIGEAQTAIRVTIAQDSEMDFRLDSILADNYKPYTVEITSEVDGSPVLIPSYVLTWHSEDEGICAVNEKGEVLGVSNGETDVIGTFGNYSDTLHVTVENAPAAVYVWEDFTKATDQWELKGSSGFNPTLVAPTDSEPAALQFTYKGTRKPYLQLTRDMVLYGLPDSIGFAFRTDAVFEDMTLCVCTDDQVTSNQPVYSISKVEHVPTNVDTVIYIATADILGGTDRMYYPITMKYLHFTLSTDTQKGTRNIWWKGINLYYKGFEVSYLHGTTVPDWQVYPNPVVDGALQIRNLAVGSTLALYDIQGRQLVQQAITANCVSLDMQQYPAGQYLLRIDNQTVKIIKK